MVDDIEKLRKKLYMLLLDGESMNKGNILKISQELDKHILTYYLGEEKQKDKLASGY